MPLAVVEAAGAATAAAAGSSDSIQRQQQHVSVGYCDGSSYTTAAVQRWHLGVHAVLWLAVVIASHWLIYSACLKHPPCLLCRSSFCSCSFNTAMVAMGRPAAVMLCNATYAHCPFPCPNCRLQHTPWRCCYIAAVWQAWGEGTDARLQDKMVTKGRHKGAGSVQTDQENKCTEQCRGVPWAKSLSWQGKRVH